MFSEFIQRDSLAFVRHHVSCIIFVIICKTSLCNSFRCVEQVILFRYIFHNVECCINIISITNVYFTSHIFSFSLSRERTYVPYGFTFIIAISDAFVVKFFSDVGGYSSFFSLLLLSLTFSLLEYNAIATNTSKLP